MIAVVAAAVSFASPSPKALHFTTDIQQVLVPYQKLMDVQELTLEAWIKVDETAKERFFNYIFCRNYSDLGYGLAIHGSPVKVFSQAPNTQVPMGKWVHVARAISKKAEKMYINGELVNAFERSGPLKKYEHPIQIGNSNFTGEPGGQPTCFRGSIDEIRVWSIPRTQDAIKHTMSRYLRGNEKGLIAYFPMEEGKGQYVRDYSGHLISGSMGRSYQPGDDDPTWTEGVKLKGSVPVARKRK